jgi:hypothetical protein
MKTLANSDDVKLSFLERAHDFNYTLDVCRIKAHMPEKHRIQWFDTLGKKWSNSFRTPSGTISFSAILYMDTVRKANSENG